MTFCTRVTSHDLRRAWANHLLVEENVSPRIVMRLGGWSSYDAIEPYLAAPTGKILVSMQQDCFFYFIARWENYLSRRPAYLSM